MQFVKYSTLTFATEDDCMDECLEVYLTYCLYLLYISEYIKFVGYR